MKATVMGMGAGADWQNSYHGKLRAAMGDATLMFVGARGVIRNDRGEFLLIQRTDNGLWTFPAGAMEIGESMAECAIRETFEETGLKAAKATLFALLTAPRYTFTNMFGDTYQHIMGSYLLEDVAGELNPDPAEASDAGWFGPGNLPGSTTRMIQWTLGHLAEFEATGLLFLD